VEDDEEEEEEQDAEAPDNSFFDFMGGHPTRGKSANLSPLYIKKSNIPQAGGGVFTSTMLSCNLALMQYTGIKVKAAVMRAAGYKRGYVMRVGGPYIDARDPEGLLVLEDGSKISVHEFGEHDWAALPSRGVRWEGTANLSRFINEASGTASPNLVYHDGWWRTTRTIQAHEELLVSTYGDGFWAEEEEQQRQQVCHL